MAKRFTPETKLSQLLGEERIEQILADHRVPCVSCPFAQMEMAKLEIGQICQMYGIDLEPLLQELNKLYEKS